MPEPPNDDETPPIQGPPWPEIVATAILLLGLGLTLLGYELPGFIEADRTGRVLVLLSVGYLLGRLSQ